MGAGVREPASAARAGAVPAIPEDDELIATAGVYRDLETGHYVCPRCRADGKRSLLVNGDRGFSCPVCTGYFVDHARKDRSDSPPAYHPPKSWMA